jgi:uncharacterized membrane protein
MATGQFSARYMRLWYRDRLLKNALAFLLGTLTYSIVLLGRITSGFVPNAGVTYAGIFLVFGLLLFLLFLDRFLHRLRPVAVAALVAAQGRRDFLKTIAGLDAGADDRHAHAQLEGEPSLSVRAPRAGAIQAIHVNGLVRWASANDCVLAFRHGVGDFVPDNAPVIDVYGNAGADTERSLQGMIALGVERTVQQDPAFAIRVMVDIAIRALSPAVNDPTTAVQVLDHMTQLLRLIGATDLDGSGERRDGDGAVRLIVPARRWEDYLTLAVAEIREYGSNSLQVVRRLRAMLDELREAVRPAHVGAVDDELTRLAVAVQREFAHSADRDRAGDADRQGVGGPTGSRTTALMPAGN